MKKNIRSWSMDEVLNLFDPIIGEWFRSRYEKLTEPQSYGIPLIHSGKNVLVSSPTGSGKTLTAFISIINELFLLAKKGKLEDKIYCVYISPLKALANDIHRNLEVPLQEIKEMAERENVKIPKIRVSVRSGDTSQSERQKMLRKPPHIFITTPESLSLALTAPKFREKFRDVKYVIMDEIHEIANNKRGVMLSLNLERLAYYAGEFQRIGLSATQSPIDEIANFLGGYKGNERRDVEIVEVETQKTLDLKVITPVEDLTLVPYEVANEKMYDILVDMIKNHRTTLIFTNTRSGTEHVAYKLKERGIESIEAHHGSLSKETRLRVENDLKEGRLKCVISSTSLELGIDIGYIDLVVQIGSPKSVAKGLQRIGRSGHAYGNVSKGRFLVFNNDDLIECTTLVKCAYEGKIDRIRIPKNSLDVLAQIIVGMSLEKRWDVEEAYSLIRNSYNYHTLPKEKFIEVLRYLGGKVLGDTVYSKIWFDENENKFGRKRSSRMIYFMNVGTIPDESDYLVIDIEGKRLGDLSEKFVERLQRGDVFVLGARSYEVVKIRGNKVIVRDAIGRRPTVPSWAGEMLPRSFDLSEEVGRFREKVEKSIKEEGEKKTMEILMKDYYLDESSARSIISYIKEQISYSVPTHKRLVIEGYIDPSKKYNIIFHFPYGRRVNDALSRAYAYKISNRFGVNLGISITDDAFMLTSKRKIPLREIKDTVYGNEIEETLKKAIFNTELFKQRFRHVATRALMVLRKYKGHDVSVARQQLRSERILKILSEIESFPVMEETYNEILNIVMDMPDARKVLEEIEKGEKKIKIIDYGDTPSIFAHGIILVGISDMVLMEDRSALLKELHLKLLEKIIPSESLVSVFTESDVREYFENKIRIKNKRDLMKFINLSPGVDIIHRRGLNIYDYSDIDTEALRNLVEELVWSGNIVSVYSARLLWTSKKLYPAFCTIYSRDVKKKIVFEGVRKAEDIVREKKMKKSEVLEILKDMERAYIVGRKIRDNEIYWYMRKRREMDRDNALEILLKNLLYFRAPLTFEEIIYSLRINEDDVRRILKYLVEEGEVVKGRFLAGYGEQYILREDYEKLKKSSGMSCEKLNTHRSSKILRKMSVDEFFDNFIVLFNEDSLKVRGCYDEFLNLISRGKIIYGRFMGGRLCYTHIKNIPLLISLYRTEKMDERDRRIISLINMLGDEATLSKVKGMSNLFPHEVKRIVEKLEKNIYLGKKVLIGKEKGNYPLIPIISNPEGNKKEFLKKIVKGYGPMSRREIENLTGIIPDEYLKDYKAMSCEGETYYHLDDKINTNAMGTFIIPREDPFTYINLGRFYDSFGEIYSHFLVKNGKVIATGELRNHGDYYEVRDVKGDKKEFLKNIASMGVSVVNFNPRIKIFRKIGNYYISGDVSSSLFSRKKIISYLLWRNRVLPIRRLKNPLEVAKFLMGIHNNFELIRSHKRINIQKYYKSELVYESIDLGGNIIYAPRHTISLFQAVKNVPMAKDMKVISSMFEKGRKMNLRDIMEESPLGIERTHRTLETLYRGNYIAKYPGGYILVEKKYPREYAVEKFINTLADIFGFLNVGIIHQFSGGNISKSEIIENLKYSSLKKGFYLNDGKMYYANDEEIENIDCGNEEIVLHPHDSLSTIIQSIFPQEFTGFLVIKGDIIGVVKASQSKKGVKISKYTSDEALDIFKRYFSIYGT